MKARWGLAVAATFVALALAELCLRIHPVTRHMITYADAMTPTRRPNDRFVYKGLYVGMFPPEFRVEKETNGLGFADGEYPIDKADGTRRVLVLGDSQVEALQVSLEETYHKRLESRLGSEGHDVEVIALGRSGYGAREALELYLELGRAYEPDLVVWGFTDQNDAHDASEELTGEMRRAMQRGSLRPPPGLRSSLLASYVLSRISPSFGPPDVESDAVRRLLPGRHIALADYWALRHPMLLEDPPPLYREALEAYQRDLIALIDAVSEDGLPMLVISTAGQSYARELSGRWPDFAWSPDKLDRITERVSRAAGADFITMKPVFEARSRDAEPVLFRRDGHLTETGHRLVAETLHAYVRARLFPEGA